MRYWYKLFGSLYGVVRARPMYVSMRLGTDNAIIYASTIDFAQRMIWLVITWQKFNNVVVAMSSI